MISHAEKSLHEKYCVNSQLLIIQDLENAKIQQMIRMHYFSIMPDEF